MKTILRRIYALAGAVVLASCDGGGGGGGGGGGTEPRPGNLNVVLATPHADDRAVILTLSGPGITDVRAGTGGYVVHSRAGAGASVSVAVFGTLGPGPLVTFTVPDLGAASQYSATLGDVADAGNALRTDVSGYTLSVRE